MVKEFPDEWSPCANWSSLTSRMDVVRHMLLPLCSRQESEKFLHEAIQESSSNGWQSIVRAICRGPDGGLIGHCGVVIPRHEYER